MAANNKMPNIHSTGFTASQKCLVSSVSWDKRLRLPEAITVAGIGTNQKRNGTLTMFHRPLLKTGEHLVKTDGTLSITDGTLVMFDGPLTKTDGTLLKTDGKSLKFHRQFIKTDGHLLNVDGTLLKVDGTSPVFHHLFGVFPGK